MITRNDLPLRAELTELEEAAISAAFMARGIAFQHGDANYDRACDAAERIAELVKGAHLVRQQAEKMRQNAPRRAANYVRGELNLPGS